MKCDELIGKIREAYNVVRILSDKNDTLTLLIKNRENGKKIVMRRILYDVDIYDRLKSILFENLPEVYDVYHLTDGVIVLEEYIDGITVGEVLESGLYTYRGAEKVLSAVCDALSVIHSAGCVHRDVKPENVMISNDGTVVLIDFNASRTVKADASHDTVMMGTPGYISPEQYGTAQSDPRTDIYALGVLLNVMLTGEHPSVKLARGRAGRIVSKATGISPKKRYQTAEDFAKAL